MIIKHLQEWLDGYIQSFETMEFNYMDILWNQNIKELQRNSRFL